MRKNYFLTTILAFAAFGFYTASVFAQCAINGLAPTYAPCDTNQYTITGTPPGGTFFGPGVVGNKFRPSAAGPGTHSISYTNTSSYIYSQVGVYGPIAGVGTSVSLSDDQVSAALPVGFSFNFYNVNYTQFYISSNGFIGFDPSMYNGCCGGVAIPNGGSPNLFIAAAWDDLYPPGGGTIDYFNTGVAPNRKLIVNYKNLPWCCGGAAQVTSQIVLSEGSNLIEIHTTMANVSPGVMGVEDQTGAIGTPATGRNGSTWNIVNDYAKFTPACITSVNVTVTALPVATMAPFNGTLCLQDPPLTLSNGAPAGGVYAGTGVSNGIFDPTVAGPGTFNIVYTYTDLNGCQDTAQRPITVLPAPTVTQAPFPNVCKSDAPFALIGGTPGGGTYSGPGVNANMFDPLAAGVGTHTITYSTVGGNGCIGFATQPITVTSPTVTFSPLSPFCVNSPSMVLTQGMPNGGTYSGTGIVNFYSFDPSVSGSGIFNVLYTYVDNSGCRDTASQWVKVNALPVVTLSPLASVCQNDPAFMLTGGSPAGGVYSGIGVSNGMFNPSAFGAGQITYTYMDPNTGCSNSASQTITITPVPGAAPAITGTAVVCAGRSSIVYSVPSIPGATGYNWVLPPGASIIAGNNTNQITVSFSTSAVSGIITVSATTTCGNGAVSPNYSVTVNPIPIASYTYLINAGVATFNNTSQYANAFIWDFGDGSPTSNSISPVHVFPGNNSYSVMLTAINNCDTVANTQQIAIVSGVGVNEEVNGQTVSIYPNPTKDELNIKLEGTSMNSLQVRLMSANGQLIYNEMVNNFTGSYVKTLDLGNEAKGIYFLQFISEKQVITKKVVLD